MLSIFWSYAGSEQPAPGSAQGFPVDIKVGGDIDCGGKLLDIRVALQQRLVAFFGPAETKDARLLLGHGIVPLGDDPSDQVAFWEICIIALQLVIAEGEQVTILQCLEVFISWLLKQKAGRRGEQFSLAGKPRGMFPALGIDEIAPEESFFDVIDAPGCFTRAEDDCLGGKLL